jgi:exodeoxyribonuclease VII large subunit
VASREVVGERRALTRLHPAAQLAMARDRAGRALDAATRAIRDRLARDHRAVERLGTRLSPAVPDRLARDRARLARVPALPGLAARRVDRGRAAVEAAASALAVLGPQATLDRGYAIVRRAADGRIVRDPSLAPAGTRLAIRVSAGDLGVVVTEPGDGG